MFFGLVLLDNNAGVSSYSSHYDRKVGDRVQVASGSWGTIKVQTATMQEANQVINAINKRTAAQRAAQRRAQDRQDAANLVRICLDAGISPQVLMDAGMIRPK